MSDSHSMTNPTGGIEGVRRIAQPALHVALMEEVLAAENLRRAWKRVKANRGAPGIDGMPIEDFARFAREQWPTIRERLSDGSYRPQPVRRVMIPKPGGGERPLGIPTVVDRLIQQAIAQVLTPIFDPEFSESSFGFRPDRCAHGALRQVQADIQPGGSTNSRSTCAAGWATSASRSITVRSRNSMSGCAGACACATGNGGAGRVPRCATFWRWARASGPRSSQRSAARATGTCRGHWRRKPG